MKTDIQQFDITRQNVSIISPQFSVHRLMLLTTKTYPNFVRIDQFLSDLLPEQMFRQTNLKRSHDNEINNGI